MMDHEKGKKVEQTLSWRVKKWQSKNMKTVTSLVYEIIRRDGAEDGSANGCTDLFRNCGRSSHQFFFCVKAIIASYLPADVVWTDLITNVGYTIGFLIAILGHMQLFTENTITTVVPLFKPFTLEKLQAVGRLWGL